MPRLRWFQGKQLVAFLRNGDYAHAGGEEAIIKVMSRFPKNNSQSVLDVGCGQGGTAQFIQENGWGRVTGIDIEENSIQYAKTTYPDIEFYTADVLQSASILKNRSFDIICLYNSFYAFSNQQKALQILSKLAHSNTQLVIYEYTDLCNGNNPFLDTENKKMVSIPVQPKKLEIMLEKANWRLTEMVDVTEEYKKWYLKLLTKLMVNKKTIAKQFGEKTYQKAFDRYNDIYNYLIDGLLGGGIFYAKHDSMLKK